MSKDNKDVSDIKFKDLKGLSNDLPSTPKNIAFIHPDLGIGGAERLVVDAAIGLQSKNHNVTIYTSHCDKTHCFEEVSSNQLNVKVYGDFLPTSILKKFHILFAILRQFYLVLRLILTNEISNYDYFIIDQLSFCIPLLNVFVNKNCKILFYCHFPDLLLSKDGGILKKLYRLPFDLIEEWSTGVSDQIVVNSNFTKLIFYKTFTNLSSIQLGTIYPCVDVEVKEDKNIDEEVLNFFNSSKYFISINRFERKKNIELAIRSFCKFKKSFHSKSKLRLVIAGGYDARINENVAYLKDLEKLCVELKLMSFTIRGKLIIMPPSTDVLFLPSIRSNLKNSLIKYSEILLYTPSFEHFGIVPVESMLFKTPVLAVNNGGPLESIVNYDGDNLDIATGFTEEPNFEKWSKILLNYFNYDDETKLKLGENGFKRVLEIFSRDKMSDAFLKELTGNKENSRGWFWNKNWKGKGKYCIRLWKIVLVVLIGVLLSLGVKESIS